MAATIFYNDDADLSLVQGRTVAIIGYGSQGHAHALNLRDSGVKVIVGLAGGSKSRAKAEAEGLRVATVAEAAAEADVIMILTPDQVQAKVYAESIEPNLKPGNALFFAHGFNIRFGYITAPEGVDVAMVAPKGPGHTVRREYEAGRGVPALVAVEKDASGEALALALSYAKALGATRAGYQPEIAYFEVLHELKLIVDLMIEGGIAKQRWSISDTAEYGDYVSGPRVISPEVKENMKAVLADIQSGAFAKRFMDDQAAGAPEFKALRAQGESHPIEATGRKLRELFSWNTVDDDYTEGSVAR